MKTEMYKRTCDKCRVEYHEPINKRFAMSGSPKSLCKRCRVARITPIPEIKPEPDEALMDLGCVSEMSEIDENFIRGISRRHFGGIELFSPAQVNKLLRLAGAIA